jgi:SAM-dependent methyltransferase
VNSMQTGEKATVAHYDESYYAGHYGVMLHNHAYYRLLSLFWKYVLFERHSLDCSASVLDFGCGIGQVSAALPETACFDFSPFAREELKKRKRRVLETREEIPRAGFDYLLSSHSLEHSPSAYGDLQEFREYLRPAGRLILVLPIELRLKPALEPDWDQHLQSWTFQTITNLLNRTGWVPLFQSVIYGPFLLRTIGRYASIPTAVRAAYWMGRLRRSYPSMLTIAKVR